MRHSPARMALAIAALAAFLGTSPVAFADTSLGQHGIVGQHFLYDSRTGGGAICTYSSTGKLKRINVEAPFVYAAGGNQEVGWVFRVQRAYGTTGSWRTTYTSPEVIDPASVSVAAYFTNEHVGVRVPPGDPKTYRYRVLVDMYWYRPTDNSLEGKATDRVDYYWRHLAGAPEPSALDRAPCPGGI